MGQTTARKRKEERQKEKEGPGEENRRDGDPEGVREEGDAEERQRHRECTQQDASARGGRPLLPGNPGRPEKKQEKALIPFFACWW